MLSTQQVLGVASKLKTGQTSESSRTGGGGDGPEGLDVGTCLADFFFIASLGFTRFEKSKYLKNALCSPTATTTKLLLGIEHQLSINTVPYEHQKDCCFVTGNCEQS